jgi:hypothetical protein
VSWTTSLLLAAVLWLDGGLRKVPAASIVMRRSPFGPWRFVEVIRTQGWRAVGRWPALVLALVSAEPERVRWSLKQIDDRLRRVRWYVLALRIVGVTTSVALVIGAPLAVERFGRTGLYYSGDALLALGLIAAITSVLAARRLDARGWTSIRFGVAFLWPFSGPYAAERVLALAVAEGSPLNVLRALAGADSFAQWARPHAYDALTTQSSRELDLLDSFDFHLARSKVEALLAVLPPYSERGSRYCPRCGASFEHDVRDCPDCSGVALITAGTDSPFRDKAAIARERDSKRRGSTIRRRRRKKR